MLNRHRKLRMEQMEAREMMAGDVSASVVKGTLYLTETAGQTNRDNAVIISQISPGIIRVGGNATTTDGTISKINGLNYQDFNVTEALDIKFAGGSDLVVFNELAPPSFTNATIDLAAPAPTRGTIPRGESTTDKDSLIMWGANIRGNLSINTGADEDFIYLGNVTANNVTINSGAGIDQVTLEGAHVRQNLFIQTFTSLTENDADDVYFDSDPNLTHPTMIDGSANVQMGGGDDGFYSTDPSTPDTNIFWLGLHTHASLTIDMGTGNDYAYLRNIRVDGNFSLDTGAGADTLDMRQTQIEGEFGFLPAVTGAMSVQMDTPAGENAVDTATLFKIGSIGTMDIRMGGGNDQLTLTGVISQTDMLLDAGTGDDVVHLNQVSAYDNFFANLGDGNDLLAIVDLYDFFGTAKIDGGAGTDRLTKSGAYPTSQVTQLNFEWINGVPQPGVVVLPVNPINATLER